MGGIKKSKHKRHPIHQHRLRKRLRAYFIYCLANCTAHGFVHIVKKKRSLFEKILWIAFVSATIVPCVILVRQSLNHWFHNPTVINLQRDHWNWRTNYPAVTMCPMSIVGEVLERIQQELNASDTLAGFLQILFFGNFTVYKDLAKYKAEYDWIDPNYYLELNNNVSVLGPFFESNWLNEPVNVEKIITEFGCCYNFNSRLAKYNTYEYWANNDTTIFNTTLYSVITSNTDGDFALNFIIGTWNVFIHSPEDLIDLESRRVYLEEGGLAHFETTSTISWTPKDVQKLTNEQRHCRFYDEPVLKYSSVYSYKLCKVDCRIKLALKKCGCIPFYYRNRYEEKICGIDGMICLSDYHNELIYLTSGGKSICNCVQNCDDQIITIMEMNLSPWIQHSRVSMGYQFNTKVRYKRAIIFSLADLIVQIGGLAGLCYGLSMLSAVELIYFITLRFFCGVILNKSI